VTLALVALLLPCVLGTDEYFYYGGDITSDHGPIACGLNVSWEDARTYDDFDLPPDSAIEGMWMNGLLTGFIPKHAYYEIRQGVSQHNGGTLLASGTVEVDVLRTGRVAFNLTEYQVRAVVPSLALPQGRYHLTFAPIGFGSDDSRSYLSITHREDLGPSSDPNPVPAGSPVGNSNSFFDSTSFGYSFERTEVVLGAHPWDFSYGVGTLTTVATTLSLADSFTVTRGVGQGGGLYELWGADDQRLIVQQRTPPGVSHPFAQVVADTATPVPPRPFGANRVVLTVESRCTAFPSTSVVERIEMYDFQSQLWVVVSEQAASSSDRQTVIDRTGEYIEQGTNRLECRVSWLNVGKVASVNWSGQIDRILWEVFP
jgi:hypothetical protein